MKYKAMIKINAVILFILASIIAGAQNVESSTIAWTTSRTSDLLLGRMTEEVNTVTVFEKNKIEWENSKGSTTLFKILTTVGTWGNINNEGKITYRVENEQFKGNVTIEKTAKDTKIIFVLIKDKKAFTTELLVSKNQIKN